MSTRAGAAPAPRDHWLPLDGVRGLAILIVIIHNSAWIAGESRHILLKLTTAITATGWIGVSLFFALSGFLITGILLDTKSRPGFFRSFYLRRTLRIFPLYYAVIAFTVFVAPLIAWSPTWADSVRANQWPFWLYLTNWILPFNKMIFGLSTFWSLAVEEQFYLFWPLLVWSFTRRRLLTFCLIVMAATPFIRLGLRLSGLPDNASYFWTIARWDALVAGAVVAALLRDDTGRLLLARWQGRLAALSAGALGALVAWQHGFHSDLMGTQVIGQSLIALLSACLLAFAVADGAGGPTRLQRWLSAPGLRTLGKYSYAMYIFHFPIHQLLFPIAEELVRGDDTAWRLARLAVYILVVLTLSLLAALGSWRLIEKPFLDLKDRIAPRPADRDLTTAGAAVEGEHQLATRQGGGT